MTELSQIDFQGGKLVVRDGVPHFRMAFYGIFRSAIYGSQLGPKVAAKQQLPGFKMHIANLLAMVSPGVEGDSVVVDIIDVPQDEILGQIDRTEHHPDWYVRTWLPGALGGVWCYLMPKERNNGVPYPEGDYLKLRGIAA